MSSSTLTPDVSKTIILLMKSTGYYVYSRILDSKGQEAYRKSMKSCLDIVNTGWTDMDIIKLKVQHVRDESTYKTGFFSSSSAEAYYHNIAVDNALDILSKLETRFITGAFKPEQKVYRYSLKESNNGIFD